VKDSPFFRHAQLMLRSLPHVAAEDCFALKGGTAINLFWRDLPRLSVDIDLTYVPVEPRAPATYDDLAAARETLIEALRNGLTPDEREFILSIKDAEPRWGLMGLSGIEKLPAIHWKLANIKKMKPAKRREAYERLQAILEQ